MQAATKVLKSNLFCVAKDWKHLIAMFGLVSNKLKNEESSVK